MMPYPTGYGTCHHYGLDPFSLPFLNEGCLKLGDCVMINPARYEPNSPYDSNENPINEICSEDFEDGPITVVTGIMGDISGSCCNGTQPVLPEVDFELLFEKNGNNIYLKNSLGISSVDLFVESATIKDLNEAFSLYEPIQNEFVTSLSFAFNGSDNSMISLFSFEEDMNFKLFEDNLVFSYVTIDGTAYKVKR